jgi:hypothetical protein
MRPRGLELFDHRQQMADRACQPIEQGMDPQLDELRAAGCAAILGV